MIGLVLALLTLLLAALPALVFLRNLGLYRPCPPAAMRPAISVLIPARNEEKVIESAVAAALASTGVDLEVLVLNDHSEDSTGAILERLAAREERLKLPAAPALPAGWCGKQHACAVLAAAATKPLIVFIDADVRLAPDGLARLAQFLEMSGADLVSGIPRQETGTLLEKLLIPLIHFVLLGFLPIWRMRASTHPSYAAGCGQLFMARREAYAAMGGHAAIRSTLHDGLRLPRAFREAGWKTDLCDATDLASCRMYRGAGEVWQGLAKNAVEGLGSPGLIVPASLLLFGGQVLPFILLLAAPWLTSGASILAIAAAGLAWLPRWLGMARFRQSVLGAMLHPLGIVLLLAIQWYALFRSILGGAPAWKGRVYTAERTLAAN